MKKTFALILLCLLVVFTAFGCDTAPADPATPVDPVSVNSVAVIDDNYRSYYQIWISSFCDSNNDDTGDIPGIISQLDYLNDGDPETTDDLGITGIWLSPTMPSPSYHKYDVTDYYNIAPEFGTLEDFDKFIAECNKRGIKVILDLVLNHASSRHPWFLQALEEAESGNFDGYAKYFEIEKSDTQPASGYRQVAGTDDLWYEGNFSGEMPEWDLSSESTREEFKKISKFWLDRGVGGFRLDAVKYFTNNHTDGIEFLTWYMQTLREINPDAYVVGENWDSNSEIYDVYESKINTQFAFSFAGADGQYVFAARNGANVKKYVAALLNYEQKIKEIYPDAINGYFLSNHDMVRSANPLSTLENEKMAAALYMLAPGNTFTYYGEEIAIKSESTDNDAYFRTPMIWDSENIPGIYVPGVVEPYVPEAGGVKQQLADENSLLNFYSRAIRLRGQNPGIARGETSLMVDFGVEQTMGYVTEYDGQKLLIVFNGSEDSTAVLQVKDKFQVEEFRGGLVASAPIKTADGTEALQVLCADGELTMPPKSAAVIVVKDLAT
ncbi:MAG: hypothetical protein LBM65_04625 [Oscillospiraceae bacterium]|nr:hypothetical protein [Oscillospiraceae bacterium]